MACLLALVLAATVLTVPSGTKLTNAARTSPAEDFWRTALPGASMPEAIRELLHPRAVVTVPNYVTRPNGDDDDDPSFEFKYNDDKAASNRNVVTVPNDVNPKHNGGGGHDDDDGPPPMTFKYNDYRAASPRRNEAAAPTPEALMKHVAGALNAAAADDGAAAASTSSTVFFLEDAVRVGESLPFLGSPRGGTAAAAAAANAPAAAPLRLFAVRAVRAVEGSSFVVCLRVAAGGAAVHYGCRPTAGPARAYAVDIVAAGDGAVAAAAVICRTDTSRWDPEHVAFRLLDVKPGGAAVCHAVPDTQVLPVANEKSPSSA